MINIEKKCESCGCDIKFKIDVDDYDEVDNKEKQIIYYQQCPTCETIYTVVFEFNGAYAE